MNYDLRWYQTAQARTLRVYYVNSNFEFKQQHSQYHFLDDEIEISLNFLQYHFHDGEIVIS